MCHVLTPTTLQTMSHPQSFFASSIYSTVPNASTHGDCERCRQDGEWGVTVSAEHLCHFFFLTFFPFWSTGPLHRIPLDFRSRLCVVLFFQSYFSHLNSQNCRHVAFGRDFWSSTPQLRQGKLKQVSQHLV